MSTRQKKGTIIVFGAHQDDIEIRAGGTVTKYAKMGYEVIYVIVIDSVYVSTKYKPVGKSFEDLSHEDILTIRNNESRKGAEVLGTSEPIFLHLKPSYYWTSKKITSWRVNFNDDDDELIENMKKYKGKYFCLEASRIPDCVDEIAEFIRKYNPEIVLTQQPNDFHLEHYAVSSLAFIACRKLVEEGMNLKLYAWEMGSCGRMVKFVPDVIIDITDNFSNKIKALKPFVSQLGNDSEIHIKYAKASARYWGAKIGVKYAEPFSEMLIAGNTGGFYLDSNDFDYSSSFSGIEHVQTQF